jgi:uncharacterized FlaG/YvyC family protein
MLHKGYSLETIEDYKIMKEDRRKNESEMLEQIVEHLNKCLKKHQKA